MRSSPLCSHKIPSILVAHACLLPRSHTPTFHSNPNSSHRFFSNDSDSPTFRRLVVSYPHAFAPFHKRNYDAKLEFQTCKVPGPSMPYVHVTPLAVSITPLDIMQMHGYGRTLLPFFRRTKKLELGREGVGIVTKGAWNYKPGDIVWISADPVMSGVFSDQIFVQENEISVVPKSLSVQEAATLPFAITTLHQILVTSHYLPPLVEQDDPTSFVETPNHQQTVLIHGGFGRIGLLAAQFLHLQGWKVIVTARSPDNFVGTFKHYDQIFFTNDNGWTSQISTDSIDVFIDNAHDVGLQQEFMRMIRPNGEYFSMRSLLLKTIDKMGLMRGLTRGVAEGFAEFAKWKRQGIRYIPVINRSYSEPLQAAANWIDSLPSDSKLFVHVDSHSSNFHGITSIPDALNYAETRPASTNGKVVVSFP